MKRIVGLSLGVFILLSACDKKKEKLFVKVASVHSGIHFKNQLTDTPELNILNYLYYYNGAGVVSADFNNDGLIDLYFTANQGEDKLYINRGGLKFEDVTVEAGINNTGNWTTGVTHVDINHDGLLDIYICKVGNYRNIKGKNLLFINKGLNEKGVPQFNEEASAYGLDFSGLSTQAAFFDYDLDGDLDMFLLNHSVHPNRTYGKGSQRSEVDSISGDRLYQNNNGIYKNVSLEAGIYQGKIGYGLGLGISDINDDGYPDIYVGNDFFENDYLYINQGDGSFKELITLNSNSLGHTTHYSMGNDLADLNNDGLTDILSLDMLPEDLETYKTSGLEYSFPTYQYYLKNGYAPQYMQNTFHLNLGDEKFSEIANLSGISATEWSWGVLAADYDNDGYKDIFISNGIKGATNDMDFISFIANENIQKKIDAGLTQSDMSFIKELPEKKVANYFFKNDQNLTFNNSTKEWFQDEKSFSNGCIYADLDNDGDLDLVVNNLNEEAFLIENKISKNKDAHYIKISLKGGQKNRFGIGTKILAYTANGILKQENFVSKGYLSAISNQIHLGAGKYTAIDSIRIIWPGGKFQTLKSVAVNQELFIDEQNAGGNYYAKPISEIKSMLVNSSESLKFRHKESTSLEFNRDPLVPFANTNEGPSISIGDINKDNRDDLFIGGAKGQASALFVQDSLGMFRRIQESVFKPDAINEDVAHVFFDANGDNLEDLLVVSGGNEFKNGKPLQPRLYINTEGIFKKDSLAFSNYTINASTVKASDFDNDGDLDITIASDQLPLVFGGIPIQYIFENDGKAHFEDVTAVLAPEFQNIGLVKDLIWTDIDDNGFQDLVVVGYWMPVSVFLNNGKTLELQKNNGLDLTNGWWNSLVAKDFDNDGDIDLVCGNWGLNSKLKASEQMPVSLYSYDFDENGTVDPIVTYFHKGKETPFASKDELVKQIPFLNKKFLAYKKFAKADLDELFSADKLKKATKLKVYELASCYFENTGKGTFKKMALPLIAQSSTLQAIAVEDFNEDGFQDMLIVGNNYEISTQLGRMDALHGVILQNDQKNGFVELDNQSFDVPGPARDIKNLQIAGRDYYIITINNDTPIFLAKNN
ncbi:MAG: VCBS repeat-containing protein [Eudoraea sp.]|uniref:VCBS repeat-containing protein n=2 Tax=Eudoraea sp. TaxID=1979955 RepID=UPI003C72FBEC